MEPEKETNKPEKKTAVKIGVNRMNCEYNYDDLMGDRVYVNQT